MLQPSLCKNYPTSSVLYCNPTPYLSSGFLALLSLVPPYSQYPLQEQIGSPQLPYHTRV